MKKFVALFVVLGMAGLASGVPITLGYADDFEGYAPGTLVGQGPWVHPANGSGIGDDDAFDAAVASGGIGTGSQAAGGGSDGFSGAGVVITGADSGLVDLNFMMNTDFGRKMLYLEGDGQQGNKTNYVQITIYNDIYTNAYWNAAGNGVGVGSPQYPIPLSENGWIEVNYHLDFDANSLSVQWRDVDDSTGGSPGSWNPIVDPIGIPFTSLTSFNYAARFVDYDLVDNFSLTVPGLAIPGDLDGDGVVAFADYQILEQQFGGPPGTPSADIDGDGVVGFADYQILEQSSLKKDLAFL